MRESSYYWKMIYWVLVTYVCTRFLDIGESDIVICTLLVLYQEFGIRSHPVVGRHCRVLVSWVLGCMGECAGSVGMWVCELTRQCMWGRPRNRQGWTSGGVGSGTEVGVGNGLGSGTGRWE